MLLFKVWQNGTEQILPENGSVPTSTPIIADITYMNEAQYRLEKIDSLDTEFSKVAYSGSYSDLSNQPTVPIKVSQLINDSGYTTIADLATVATTGSYNDLSDTPEPYTPPTSTVVYENLDTTTEVRYKEISLDADVLAAANYIEIIYTDYLNGNIWKTTGKMPIRLIEGVNFTTAISRPSVDALRERTISIVPSTSKLVISVCSVYTAESTTTTYDMLIPRQVILSE